MSTLTVFDILMFEGRSVLSPAQWNTGSEWVKTSVNNQKTIFLLLKLKDSIFEISIIAQILIINDQRTTSTKSINLDIIRKLIKYSIKKMLVKAMFTLVYSYHFQDIAVRRQSVLSRAHRGTGSERVKQQINKGFRRSVDNWHNAFLIKLKASGQFFFYINIDKRRILRTKKIVVAFQCLLVLFF